jgi:RNA polymerase sigma factor (sigma-70 family)
LVTGVQLDDRSVVLPASPCFPSLLSAPSESPDSSFSFAEAERLSIALRKGDQGAFRFLHAEWNHRIVRYCFALSAGDDAFAMEVAQATYIRIFNHVPPLKDETALWNWIACVARSAANDLRRVNGRYRAALCRFGDWLRFGLARSPNSAAECDVLTALDRGLLALSDDDRRLLDARYFRRMALDEIAQANQLTIRAVEGRLARARERLRVTIAAALNQDDR